MNENYKEIISKGYQLDVTTGAKNRGTMFLMKNGAVVHRAGPGCLNTPEPEISGWAAV